MCSTIAAAAAFAVPTADCLDDRGVPPDRRVVEHRDNSRSVNQENAAARASSIPNAATSRWHSVAPRRGGTPSTQEKCSQKVDHHDHAVHGDEL